MLLFGGGVLEGHGLLDHALGLPGYFADALAGRSGRGVDVDIIVDRDPTDPVALKGLRGLRLFRYDAVFVVLGEVGGATSMSAKRLEARFAALSEVLLTQTSDAAPLFMIDSAGVAPRQELSPRARKRSAATVELLVAAARRTCALSVRIKHEELSEPLAGTDMGSRYTAETYRMWADALVSRLLPRLAELERTAGPDVPSAYRRRPDPEPLRQRAVDCLRLTREQDEQLDEVVRRIRRVFAVSGAAINFIDRDVQWQKAHSGRGPGDAPREIAFCNTTIRADDFTLFSDTKAVPELEGNPLTEGPDATRFYLGFPLRTWDGYRVGALCVTDPEPRWVSSAELNLLRDTASDVERILWESALNRRRQ